MTKEEENSRKAVEMREIMKPLSGDKELEDLKISNSDKVEFGYINDDEPPGFDEHPSYRYGTFNGYSWLPLSWNEFLFPPGVPAALQLLRSENIAVPFCYLVVGLLQGE